MQRFTEIIFDHLIVFLFIAVTWLSFTVITSHLR
jgi:hypothetical protein